MNPSSTLAVFGGSEANLRVGLETLLGGLNASSRQGVNAELTRYTLRLMVLERKLSSAKGALDTLGNRINGLLRQLEHFDLQSETLMSAMAAIYVDVISPLGPRIQVTGSPAVLQSPQVHLQSETLMSAMAAIYVDVISPLGPRIQVTGSPAVLQSPQVQAKVRATLLAGIRAAVLWHQVGGGRLQLMFSRNRLTTQAKQILAHLTPEL